MAWFAGYAVLWMLVALVMVGASRLSSSLGMGVDRMEVEKSQNQNDDMRLGSMTSRRVRRITRSNSLSTNYKPIGSTSKPLNSCYEASSASLLNKEDTEYLFSVIESGDHTQVYQIVKGSTRRIPGNFRDSLGRTPLTVLLGNWDMILTVVDCLGTGADYTDASGRSPLALLLQMNDQEQATYDVADFYLKKMQSPATAIDARKRNLLHALCGFHHTEDMRLMRAMQEKGVSARQKDDNDLRPVDLTAMRGWLRMTKHFLLQGVLPDRKTVLQSPPQTAMLVNVALALEYRVLFEIWTLNQLKDTIPALADALDSHVRPHLMYSKRIVESLWKAEAYLARPNAFGEMANKMRRMTLHIPRIRIQQISQPEHLPFYQ